MPILDRKAPILYRKVLPGTLLDCKAPLEYILDRKVPLLCRQRHGCQADGHVPPGVPNEVGCSAVRPLLGEGGSLPWGPGDCALRRRIPGGGVALLRGTFQAL